MPSPTAQRRWLPSLGRLTVCLAGLLVLVALVVAGDTRHPAGPASGAGLQAAQRLSPATRPTLRIGTFNINGSRALRQSGHLAAVADLLRQADVDLVGLNEVHGAFLEQPGQVEIIADRLRMGWLFAPTERRWWHDSFGNALVSRRDVLAWQRIALPGTQNRGHRNVLLVRMTHLGREVAVLITHLDRTTDRAAQLEAVLALFASLQAPAVLVGDLNTDQHDPRLRLALADGETRDALGDALWPGRPLAETPHRIDWILTRGLRALSGGIVEPGVSDHPFFYVELE